MYFSRTEVVVPETLPASFPTGRIDVLHYYVDNREHLYQLRHQILKGITVF